MQFNTEVATAETEYGTVLLDQLSGEYWQLNPTGTLVIRTLLAGGGEDDAIRALTEEFDVDREQAAHDVQTLVTQLRESGLAS
ncbi:lasso peptide biosynthesis PqqD family chaperone [Saccharopolyspora sp. NPDC003752]